MSELSDVVAALDAAELTGLTGAESEEVRLLEVRLSELLALRDAQPQPVPVEEPREPEWEEGDPDVEEVAASIDNAVDDAAIESELTEEVLRLELQDGRLFEWCLADVTGAESRWCRGVTGLSSEEYWFSLRVRWISDALGESQGAVRTEDLENVMLLSQFQQGNQNPVGEDLPYRAFKSLVFDSRVAPPFV